MDREPARLRHFMPDDVDHLYRICLRTADNGQDATGLFQDPRTPGDVYVAPYVTFEPSLAFVAEDGAGVGGYIVAALDSQVFDRRLERDWWPGLRARYPEAPQDQASGISLAERYARHDIHPPLGAPAEMVERFPSHLHVNLVPRMQGRGIGRRLVMTLISSLRDHGSPGVHLLIGHSNQRAIAFYRHIGFTELAATGVHIFAMGLGRTGERQDGDGISGHGPHR
jgi:ribosomal protein S18 acetylase RimI-like enzyme